ncbi:MAG: FAD-dependent oxidoreductase [Gammaproteobacteria bacterium]|jgi:glycine/D-amino acid oxidase-like deaminating enzyme|nr:FAD-dependent oxidoreductase [Gammaproteobacteria bacterium]
MRTVILGNGIVGLSIAFRLLGRLGQNDQIVVIGEYERPGSATLAAAAMLNSFAEIEAGGLDTEIDLYRFELSHLATQMWPKFERDIIDAAASDLPKACANCSGCAGGGCFATGTYVVNNTSADDLDDENFDAILQALKDFNEPFDMVSPREIPNYQPAQAHRATRALLIHGEGWFNPRVMVEKLDAALRRDQRVLFINDAAMSLSRSGLALEAAVLRSGQRVEGDRFVLATGATSTDLLARSDLGLDIQRVFYGVGVSVEIKSPDFPHSNCIRTPNRGLACGLYSVPYFQGPNDTNDHVLIGASNFISPVPYQYGRITSVESLMRGAMEQINTNFYRADLVRVNVGWRPTSQDTYPLLGKTSVDNLIIATGTKRDGFHLAPLIAERIVNLLMGESVEERFACFSPERKPIRALTREQAIEKAVRHQMSAAYQHGFVPPLSRMPSQVSQMFRDGLERLHDHIGAFDWGIPPEMLDMYRYGHATP